jgi:superoxide reductase
MKIIKSQKGNIMMVLKEVESISDKEIKPNSVDASFEKHVPVLEVTGDSVYIAVNHVMERDHYIEWIMVDYGDKQIIKYFSPGDVASMIVNYKFGMKVYSYCNKHGLWVSEEI